MILFLSGISITLLFIILNLFRKYEYLEREYENTQQKLENIYSALSITLHTIRVLDERKMFENDDEVGIVFQEIVNVVNNLRPFIYETMNDNTPPAE
jgi:hypothetical protein